VDVNPGTLPLDQRDVVRLADLFSSQDGSRIHVGTNFQTHVSSRVFFIQRQGVPNIFTPAANNMVRVADHVFGLAVTQQALSSMNANALDDWFSTLWMGGVGR
jgi:hypothetical protein